jgi:DNA gyrase subunit A
VALLRWEFAGQQPGSLERFLPDSLEGAAVAQLLTLTEGAPAPGLSLGLLSSDGRFKRLPIEEFRECSGRAASVLRLRDGVRLLRVLVCRDGDELVVASSTGRLLRVSINEAELPLMGRNAQGPVLLRLLPGETMVGAAAGGCEQGSAVLLASSGGQVKKLAVEALRLCRRGDLGQIGLRFLERQDRLVDLCGAGEDVVAVRTGRNRSLRLLPSALAADDLAASGSLLPLAEGEELVELVPLAR